MYMGGALRGVQVSPELRLLLARIDEGKGTSMYDGGWGAQLGQFFCKREIFVLWFSYVATF